MAEHLCSAYLHSHSCSVEGGTHALIIHHIMMHTVDVKTHAPLHCIWCGISFD